MSSALLGRRILVTRPAAQSAGLIRMVEHRGGIVLPLPLFAIEPLMTPGEVRSRLARARDADGWIFTSTNAARLCTAAEPDAASSPWPQLLAVGKATARALAEGGRPGTRVAGTGSDSEALLEAPEMVAVREKRFLICTGTGGRDLIASTLTSRGARVETLALYRRIAVDHAAAPLDESLRAAEALIVTSGEGLQRLHALAPAAAYPTFRQRLLVAPSNRVLELAAQFGFTVRLAPTEMSDAALVDCLEAGLATAIKPQ